MLGQIILMIIWNLGSSRCCLGVPLLSRLPSQHEVVICNRQDKLITFKLIFDTVWDILIS